jgi:TonB family protein
MVFVPFNGLGLFALARGPAVPHHEIALADATPDLVTTCTGDAGLGASARYALCAMPWVTDVDQCLGESFTNMWMYLSACSATSDPGIAVAMLEPKAIEKLAAIDAEKLLDESMPAPPMPAVQLQPQTTPPPPPPPPEVPMKAQQVVETAKPNHEEEPQNARLLAEYNTKVEKEKVARGATKEPMVAKSKPEALAVKDKPKDEPPAIEKPVAEDRKPGKNDRAPDSPNPMMSMRNPGAPAPAMDQQDPRSKGTPMGARGPSIADGFMPKRGDGAIEQDRHERQEIPRGQNGGGGGAPPNLKPSKEMLERIAGGGNVDHLDEVDDGDETALTAKRWVYASFFNRIKRQVAQNWDPQSVWHRVDPTGQVNGFKTRITEIRATLTPSGAIDRILVITPSGVGELDEEGMRAFKAAGPFPNPPDGLVAKDGMITFAFSFYFEIAATHSSWRIVKSS